MYMSILTILFSIPDPSPPLAQMTTQATEVTDISDDVLVHIITCRVNAFWCLASVFVFCLYYSGGCTNDLAKMAGRKGSQIN